MVTKTKYYPPLHRPSEGMIKKMDDLLSAPLKFDEKEFIYFSVTYYNKLLSILAKINSFNGTGSLDFESARDEIQEVFKEMDSDYQKWRNKK